ncbi:MAG: glutathione S-transferase family protein [Pseudohongiellaceae bacterium]
MKLILGNKNYSSWSLRPWLLLSHFNIAFEEVNESIAAARISDRLGKWSPSRRVPVLVDGELTVWDSLAICEYLSEKYLQGNGWPGDGTSRATARAVCAEMHAGFTALRSEMPMNCRATREVKVSRAALDDIQRIDEMWARCREREANRGPWLFGGFSIADCFYAPVVLRFKTYGVKLSPLSSEYSLTMLAHTHLNEWTAQARQETEVLPEEEKGREAGQ